MKYIWNIVNRTQYVKDKKNSIFMWIMNVLSIIVGLLLWMVIGKSFLNINWIWCFIGLPVVAIGIFGSILYLFNHEFD